MGVNLKQGYFGTPPIVRDGLTLYLDAGSRKSYVSGSTTWTDLSGNGYNATGVNTPGFSTDNQGTTVLNGSSQYFTLPAGVTVSSTAGFTLSSTYRITMPASNLPVLFQVRTSSGAGYIILFGTGVYDPFAVGVNGTGIKASSPQIAAFTGSWHNITVTNDGGGLNTVASTRVYLDGVSLSLTTGGALGSISNTSVVGTLNAGVANRYVNGNIAQCLVYNRVLSAGEVAQNYNALKARFGLT